MSNVALSRGALVHPVLQTLHPAPFRAVIATKHPALRLQSVSHDPAPAVRTFRRQRVDRALEAVEGVRLAGHHDLERLVVLVATGFAALHGEAPFTRTFLLQLASQPGGLI